MQEHFKFLHNISFNFKKKHFVMSTETKSTNLIYFERQLKVRGLVSDLVNEIDILEDKTERREAIDYAISMTEDEAIEEAKDFIDEFLDN